jgi:transcriptional pleiotropic regulator of transition state genes
LRIGISKGVPFSLKSTGMIRKIDNLGRIVIPTELRAVLGIKTKDPLEIFVDDDAIILVPYRPGCVFCGRMEELGEFRGKKLCKKCIDESRIS